MKKVMMTVFMATLLPVIGMNQGSTCLAEDVYTEKSHYPDVAPVYKSYYDYSTNMLYIYGAAEYTMVNVRVTYKGCVVLADCVAPEDLPAVYDLNGCDSGIYQVVVSAGSTVLTTFSFEK